MRIKIINPNTTAIFTERVRAAAAKVAAPGTVVLAGNPLDGAASIESHAEEALGAIGVIGQVEAGERDGIDGYVVACFGDTGVHAAREVAHGPVVGMSEAALYTAAMLAQSFSIVTLPRRTRAHALRVLHETGLAHRCTVRAVDVAVLDLEHEAEAILPVLRAEARLALAHDHAEAIILGCAGLTELVAPLERELGVPVIDGVLAGLKTVEGLVAAGLRTSKHSTYADPGSGFQDHRGIRP
ncbi:MAG TPA: aspartate/glutamate racemase family protein [Lichenihabitans sp.]|jgi:allantoin racemase|nr:aspartate/glutamate racemase family protein [Lichenihabitans sp.]